MKILDQLVSTALRRGLRAAVKPLMQPICVEASIDLREVTAATDLKIEITLKRKPKER
jgi:hypothetical protein